MPIINGKKRYVPEAPAGEPMPTLRYQPEPMAAPETPVKRYKPEKVEVIPTPKKRASDGGAVVTASKDQEKTRSFLNAFEFDVRINMVQITFSKITNLGGDIELETFVEGGNNDYPIIRQKSRSKPQTLVLEKGLTDSAGASVFSAINQGMRLTNIMIFVKNNGSIKRTYSIDQALVVSKSFSNLDANVSQVFVERLELAHNGVTEVKT